MYKRVGFLSCAYMCVTQEGLVIGCGLKERREGEGGVIAIVGSE